MSGKVLVVRGLLRRGVPHGLAIAAMLADLVSWYAAYALVGAAALVILGLRGRERSLPRWVQRLPWANEVLATIADAEPGAIFGVTLAVRRP